MNTLSSKETRAMSSTQTLNSATQARKARLAQLQSLKRKQPPTDDDNEPSSSSRPSAPKSPRYDPQPSSSTSEAEPPTDTSTLNDNAQIAGEDEDEVVLNPHLSHRNYDPATKTARLGFEATPSTTTSTLESRAAALAASTKDLELASDTSAPLDLFTLQPKKANWDLKRDLERKMVVLGVRTDNAIARLVRERVAAAQKAKGNAGTGGDAEAGGLEGATLVEALNVKEREAEEEERREREEVEGIGEGV